MSVTRALTVLAVAIATGTVGGAVIIGASAGGSTPDQPSTPAFRAANPAPDLAPVLQTAPRTTLNLPAPLHVVNQTTGARKLDSSHSVFYATITKPRSQKVIGTAAHTCVAVTSGTVRQDCHSALALRGGVMVFDDTLDIHTGKITGTVLGGTGKYSGASGTVSGHDLGGGKDKLTINYSFS